MGAKTKALLSLFGRKGLSLPTPIRDYGNYFYSISGGTRDQDTRTPAGQAQAYERCPAVSGIISRKVKAHLNGIITLEDMDGKPAGKSAFANNVRALLAKPNALQSWGQFEAQAIAHIQLFGEVFIFAVVPAGFGKSSIKAIWILPNQDIDVRGTGKYWAQTDAAQIIDGYYLGRKGEAVKLDSSAVLHIKDAGLSSNMLRGVSRLAQLQDPVSNIIAAYEARNVLITRRGAIGIMSNDTKDTVGHVPLKPDEKDDLQRDFARYGMSREQWQVIITNAALKWQSMTFPTRDLMLFEEIEDSVRQIADNYDYPMHLLGFKAGTTFSNVSEAKKSLYEDAIIPESAAFFGALSDFLECPKNGLRLASDFSHLSLFQESEQQRAQATLTTNQAYQIAYTSGIVSLEEWRAAIGLDPKKPTGTYTNGQS